jgi:hypothetical protein
MNQGNGLPLLLTHGRGGPARPGWPAIARSRHRVCTPSPHRLAVAAAVQDAAGLGSGAASARWGTVTGPKREMWPVWRRVTGELEEDGWPWSSSPEKIKIHLGKRWTDHEFIKRKTWRCRDWDEPQDESGIGRRWKTSPEKLAEPSSEVQQNASCRCRTSARGGGSYERRLAIRVILLKPRRRGLRRHIYIVVGFGNFSDFLNFGLILIPRIK